MKAVTVEGFGGPERLRFGEVPDPASTAGQVIVSIAAAGVGFVDVMARQGRYVFPQPGFIPGLELVGTVLRAGAPADTAWIGRKVIAFPRLGGAYAEQVALEAKDLIPLPDGIDSDQALAIGVNGLVAAIGLDRCRPAWGERILIRGAGGGIGLMATQLAARVTDDVTATTSSEARGRRLKALGATTLWNRRADPPLAGRAFDVIIDTVGGAELAHYAGLLRPNGRYLLCGGLDGPPPADFGAAFLTPFHLSLSFAALSLNSLSADQLSAPLDALLQAVRQGALAAVVDSRLALADAPDAHRRLEAGEAFGKIILTP